MYRFLFRFVATTLTILTANLLTNAISGFMVGYKNQYKPLTFTLIGMAIVVLVFYTLFVKLEDWVKNISVKLIRSGNSLAGKYLGLSLVFICGLLILFYFYARTWYNIDFIQVLLHDKIRRYF
jgi:hypothetical protein